MANGRNICEVDGSDLATARFPRTPQLPPSSRKGFHAVKKFFFLAAFQLKAKGVETYSGRRPVLKYCTGRCNVKCVVSRVTNEKVLKAFFLERRVLSTRDEVGTTRQRKFSTLVKAAWRYDVPFPRTQKLQTHTHTHTHGIPVLLNRLDEPRSGTGCSFIM